MTDRAILRRLALPIVAHAAASWQGSARLPLTYAIYFDTLLIRYASTLANIETYMKGDDDERTRA
jgi:hypothetical protein